jgi:hypothetical protein
MSPETGSVLGRYSRKAQKWPSCPLSLLPEDILKRSMEVGVISDEEERAATYLQIDHSVVFQAVQDAFQGKIEIMSTREALKRYGWLREYWWGLIKADADEYTKLADSLWDQGYFIRVFEGEKVFLPLQSCLLMSTENLNQNVHNIIIAEPRSEAQIITGCTVHPNVHSGLHVGVSEFYVKEGAKVTFTMIHSWAQEVEVRPRSAALIENGATFISNYVCLKPVKNLQMYPTAYCRGADSRVSFNSILYGVGNSKIDVGAKVVLQGEGSRGEVVSRAIATDNAQIYVRGFLLGEHGESRAHLECRGLLLSDGAVIYAIPELLAKVRGAELSHEAAVGKIAEDQILYLMARGFSRDEAESLIVRGFMDVSILGLPDKLSSDIKRMVDATTARAL